MQEYESSLNHTLPYKDGIGSVPIRENTGQPKPAFSHNLCSDYEFSQQCLLKM